MQVLRGFLGVAVILGICYALSRDRRRIRLRVVLWGLGLQLALALVLFKTEAGMGAFQALTDLAAWFLSFSYEGSGFVFGEIGRPGGSFSLAFQALPMVIYFSAAMAVLYHLGVMQVVIYGLGRALGKVLGVSGAESMSVVADIFVGMTEAPLVIRPYIERMTRSELMALLTGGLATIAGTVLGLYMRFVGPDYAAYLIAASFMAAPAAFVVAKVIVPETEEPATGKAMRLVIERPGTNLLDAIAIGVRDGLGLALNIAAMLIAFYALIHLVNWPLERWLGASLQEILGWVLSPFAWALGADWADAPELGSLLGTKVVANELIAYQELRGMIQGGAVSDRTVKIATFALCGFANFGSIGVVLGGVGQLAPSRRPELARLALLAMTAGALATCLTGAIAGMFA
ncbi:MAG: NupC/NupG family nucleoside CNT transporter [Planctomycetes bacterium]|nr:NupC/NupG family nucleoside CNT transporter [Planctomycetota bacterium]